MAIWMIGIVHFSLPFGFRGLWNFLINGPPTPFKSLDTTVLLMLCMSLTAQLAVARLMWIWFRRAQTTLPLPWREFDMSDIFECVSAPTPLRGIHFLYLRRGSERRRVVRRTPWHFRHTLITAYYSIIAYSVIKFGRLSGVLVVAHLVLIFETYWLLHRQADAAFRRRVATTKITLNYRQKPRFAQAALLQMLSFFVTFALLASNCAIAACVLFFIPMMAFGTLLMYLIHGHSPDYVNSSSTVYGGHSDKICDICESVTDTRLERGRSDAVAHHQTRRSLQKSAQHGCRICSAV
jgi:hypothetical protein